MTLVEAIKSARHLAQQTGRNQNIGYNVNQSIDLSNGYYIGKSGDLIAVTPTGEIVMPNE